MRTNVIMDAITAIWTVLEGDSNLISLVDNKTPIKRLLTEDDFEPGRAPFFSGWPTSPEQVWWAMAPVLQIQLQMDFYAVVCEGDKDDLSGITQVYIEFLGALVDDLCANDLSILRGQGRINKFQIQSPLFLYGRYVDTDQGIFMLQTGGQFDITFNPDT